MNGLWRTRSSNSTDRRLAEVMAGCVHLCRVSGNTVWSHNSKWHHVSSQMECFTKSSSLINLKKKLNSEVFVIRYRWYDCLALKTTSLDYRLLMQNACSCLATTGHSNLSPLYGTRTHISDKINHQDIYLNATSNGRNDAMQLIQHYI